MISRAGGISMLWPVTGVFVKVRANKITCFREVVGDLVKNSTFVYYFCMFLSLGEFISCTCLKAQKVSGSKYWRGDSDKCWDLWEKSLWWSPDLHYLTDSWSLPLPLLSTMKTIDKLNLQTKTHTYSICFSFFLGQFSLDATSCTCTFCWLTFKSNLLTCLSKMISISYCNKGWLHKGV